MFPTIPDDLKPLSIAELRELKTQIKSAAMTVLADGSMPLDEVNAKLAERATIDAAISEKKAENAATAATLAEEEEDVDKPEAPAVDDKVEEAATPAAPAKPLPTTFGQAAAADAPPSTGKPQPKARITVEALLAADGVKGKDAGDGFESWAELAHAAVERSANIRRNTDEKHVVARLVGNYPKERVLSDNVMLNLSKFEPDELMAALCAPAVPYYGLACMNTTRRPVFNSLAQFQAPRGKVSIQSSPQLSDITTGVGQWTAANEASTNATKSACQTISCGSTTEYQIYGVYRCLTVRNLLAMTYPELVEAWLNRLAAAHARLAEQQLLNAMGTASTSITTPALGYGATQSMTTTILNYLALYQETQRWDWDGPYDAWIPRWVQWGVKMDLARRRRHDGGYLSIPTDAEVDSIFRDSGVTPHWFLDTPTWATAIPAVATGGKLNLLPANVQILIAPPGKYALMDRGELSIGVTGNNIYRDNTSNNRNEFTFFFENFEGIVNTTSCPNHIIDVQACWSGVQIDDIVINCQGGDETGYQS